MSKTNYKHKKPSQYEQDDYARPVKKKKTTLNKKHQRQLDNILRSKDVSRIINLEENY